MKPETVTSIKRNRHRDIYEPPHAGTPTRALYDLFMANKGRCVDTRQVSFVTSVRRNNCIKYLSLAYGLDIRMIKHFQFMLVGEWIGKEYVDYLAAEIAKEDAKNENA